LSDLKKILEPVYTAIFGAYHIELKKSIAPYKSLIDIGCGSDSSIRYFSDELDATGVDGFAPAIEASKQRGIHKRYLLMDLNDIGEKIPEKSYDCVLCADVVEHFEKEQSRKFIGMLERIARRRVVLFTPNGYVPQGAVDGNEFQIHRCGWEVDELEALGYSVTGIYGHKALRGECANYKIKPAVLGRLISDITQPFVRNCPQKAFALLAVKNI
jgi:hypothetical protein